MEYAIAVFVGVWIAAAGLLAYKQISADYANVAEKKTTGEENI